MHGFNCPDLGVRADIKPGEITKVRIVPDRVGSFTFFCDIFCGEGHEDMNGKIIVEG
jgi:cytochrome c oxidase subunit 2